MKALAMLQSWLRRATARSTFEREMDEELRFHIESYAGDLERSGVPPAEARRRAAVEFGGVEARKEDCRQAIGLRVVDEVPITIVGINPPRFDGVEPGQHPDLFMPLLTQPLVAPYRHARTGSLLDDPDYWWLLVMGRIRSGVSDTAAQTALENAFQQVVRATLPGSRRKCG